MSIKQKIEYSYLFLTIFLFLISLIPAVFALRFIYDEKEFKDNSIEAEGKILNIEFIYEDLGEGVTTKKYEADVKFKTNNKQIIETKCNVSGMKMKEGDKVYVLYNKNKPKRIKCFKYYVEKEYDFTGSYPWFFASGLLFLFVIRYLIHFIASIIRVKKQKKDTTEEHHSI